MKTVYEVLSDLEFLVGHDKESCLAIDWLNQARQLLYPLGDFPGTVGYACLYVSGECFYLPRGASHIKSAWACGRIDVVNEENRECQMDRADLSAIIKEKETVTRITGNRVLINEPVKRDLIGFRPSDANDSGKKALVGYKDIGGSMTSEVIELAGIKEIVWTKDELLRLHSITKDATDGAVNIYAGSPNNVRLLEVAEHWEQSLSRVAYRYSGCARGCVGVEYKKKFYKYTKADFHRPADIESAMAISHAISAIKLMQEKNSQASGLELRLAKGFLEADRQDLRPKAGPAITPRIPAIV